MDRHPGMDGQRTPWQGGCHTLMSPARPRPPYLQLEVAIIHQHNVTLQGGREGVVPHAGPA
jgi:hypothetical protein